MIRVVKYIVIVLLITAVAFGANQYFSFLPKLKIKGLFNRKAQLLETPTVVKEIKKIGELITGEFYGETFADLDDVYTSLVKKYKDTSDYVRIGLAHQFPQYEEFSKKNEKAIASDDKKEELQKQLQKIQIDYEKARMDYRLADSTSAKEIDKLEQNIDDYLEKIRTTKESRKKERKFFGKEDKVKIEALDQIINEASAKLDKSQDAMKAVKNNLADAKDKYEEAKKKYEKGKKDVEAQLAEIDSKIETSKRKLVYIGRGWVKAGYKLDSLTDKNIKIETKNDTSKLYLTINKPIILNADINPWFIEKELEGYEIFRNEKAGTEFTQEEVTAVKVKCRENLIDDALRNGLMKKAQTSGEQTLIRFFKMLGFTEVHISYFEDKKDVAGTN